MIAHHEDVSRLHSAAIGDSVSYDALHETQTHSHIIGRQLFELYSTAAMIGVNQVEVAFIRGCMERVVTLRQRTFALLYTRISCDQNQIIWYKPDSGPAVPYDAVSLLPPRRASTARTTPTTTRVVKPSSETKRVTKSVTKTSSSDAAPRTSASSSSSSSVTSTSAFTDAGSMSSTSSTGAPYMSITSSTDTPYMCSTSSTSGEGTRSSASEEQEEKSEKEISHLSDDTDTDGDDCENDKSDEDDEDDEDEEDDNISNMLVDSETEEAERKQRYKQASEKYMADEKERKKESSEKPKSRVSQYLRIRDRSIQVVQRGANQGASDVHYRLLRPGERTIWWRLDEVLAFTPKSTALTSVLNYGNNIHMHTFICPYKHT